MPDGSPNAARVYRPRPPGGSELQRWVGAALPAFYREAERNLPRGLPRFVTKELDAFVGCGDFSKGFVELSCEGCPATRRVAFSCKTRGFCPSCGGKRMTGLAAHLVDRVLPHVPVRQFVLTVPFELRAKMAYDATFAREVRRALHASLQAAYPRRAAERGHPSGRTGGVTAVQRFGSGLNLHVHLHALVLDGVFEGPTDALRFVDGRPWCAELVGKLLVDVVRRLVQRGLVDFEADALAELAQLAEQDPMGVASCMHRIALGPRRGQRVECVGAAKLLRGATLQLDPQRPKARYAGFDLEASVRIPAHDRRALERLCRYLLRQPLAEKRLRASDHGKLEVELKSRWPDGTTHLRFTPIELVEKLAALVPRPHENLLVYHGILAAHAADRAAYTAHGRPGAQLSPPDPASSAPHRCRGGRDWATLMRRGLDLEVLTCPDCGARFRIHALHTDPRIAAPLARQLGLARPRAGPADLPASRDDDTHYEPDLDFVEPDYDACPRAAASPRAFSRGARPCEPLPMPSLTIRAFMRASIGRRIDALQRDSAPLGLSRPLVFSTSSHTHNRPTTQA